MKFIAKFRDEYISIYSCKKLLKPLPGRAA